jgi:hypothetical protein
MSDVRMPIGSAIFTEHLLLLGTPARDAVPAGA